MKIIRDCICASDDKIRVALNALRLSDTCVAPGNFTKWGGKF